MHQNEPHAFHVAVTAARGFCVSFEAVAAALEQFPRLYFEPDGSFVWAGEGWQIDGSLYDRDGTVQYLEIKGNGPAEAVGRLLATLQRPLDDLTVQLVREGISLPAPAFVDRLTLTAPEHGTEAER